MDDSYLLKASLALSIVGVIALYVLSLHIELPETKIMGVTDSDGKIRIHGTVAKAVQGDSVTFIDVYQTERIRVVVFDSIALAKGEKVEIVGQLADYGNSTEIIAETINVLGS